MKALLTTCGADDALPLLRRLLEERLVGCGNCVPGLRSLYWWEDEIQDDPETLLLMETPAARCDAAVARLRELHPYEVPKILVLAPEHTDPDYLRWLLEVTGGD